MAIEFDKIITALHALPDAIRSELESELKGIAAVIENEAKSTHNFVSRTGRLESSVTVDYTDTGIRAYLDTGVAPYAGYIHDGTKYISPDPFLERAFTAHVGDIDAAIGRAVDKAFGGV